MEHASHIPTVDELVALPLLGDVQISPDGAHVAYTVETPDWEQNEYVAQIWLVDAARSRARQLTFGPAPSRSPCWSPDGQSLAFLSKRRGDEYVQVYRLCPFGGEAERLTSLETDAQSPAWSPDGRSVAFLAPDPDDEAAKRRKERYGEYRVEDEDYRRCHLWRVRLEDRKVDKLTSGDAFHVAQFDWHPEGGRIALATWPTPDVRDAHLGRVYVLDLAMLVATPLTGEGASAPHWSPDGTELAYMQDGTPAYFANNDLCLVPAAGGAPRRVPVELDERLTLEKWGPDGLYVSAIQRTAIHLFCVHPRTGAYTRLTPVTPAGWIGAGAVSFSRDFSRAALIVHDAEHLGEVTLLDAADGTARRLTDFSARVADWPLGRYEVIQWTSTDGTPVEGVLTRPADFDPARRYPLLVVIHGGPVWVSFPAPLMYVECRNYPLSRWVARGALVLQPNYRGSAGYGAAFRALNVRNLGVGDAWDVLSGVDALIARGWADPERVGVMGWSQGGYIAAFLATTSDRFRAASVGAGISNWVTYYANTDVHPFTRQYLEATPWEDPEVYRKTSPMTYIRQARTPTLIQHGELDRRVPLPNAYELYQGLRDMGVETRLVVYKGMPHGITKPRLSRQAVQENLDWFNRWIWGDAPPEAEPAPCYVALAAKGCGADGASPGSEVQRSTSLEDVQGWARRDGAAFRILAPEHGLLSATDPAPAGEVPFTAEGAGALAARLAEQIRALGATRLVVYTAPAEHAPCALIAVGCLQIAAGSIGGVIVEHRQVAEWVRQA